MRDKIKAAVKDSIQPAPIPHLVFGIDRSGSMLSGSSYGHGRGAPGSRAFEQGGYGKLYVNPGSRAMCVEDAYKYIIEDQLKLALPAIVSVYAHDDRLHKVIVRKPMVEAATITINPWGENAMYSAFMELVRIHKDEECVMLTFMADGEDRFEGSWIKEMHETVKHYTAKGWFFAYIGVGGIKKGGMGSASTFGIPEENAIYTADGEKAVREGAIRLSQMATAFRTGAR